MLSRDIADSFSELVDSLAQVLDVVLCHLSPASLSNGSGSSHCSLFQLFFMGEEALSFSSEPETIPSLPWEDFWSLFPVRQIPRWGAQQVSALVLWASERFILVLSISWFFVCLFLNFSFYILGLITMCLEQRMSSVQELTRYLSWKYKYIALYCIIYCIMVQKQFVYKCKVCATRIMRTSRLNVT